MIKSELRMFIIIGMINTIIGLSSSYMLFNILSLNYWLSTLIGNGLGMLSSYMLNRRFTFRDEGKMVNSFIKFIAVVLSCYFFSYWFAVRFSSMVSLYVLNLGEWKGNISILIGAGIYTMTNFLGQKYLVFHSTRVRMASGGCD